MSENLILILDATVLPHLEADILKILYQRRIDKCEDIRPLQHTQSMALGNTCFLVIATNIVNYRLLLKYSQRLSNMHATSKLVQGGKLNCKIISIYINK